MKNSIIINFPTNIGDTVLSLPVLDQMRAANPKSKITAIVSSRTKEFLSRNDFIDEVIVFDKKWTLKQKLAFGLNLRGKYDIVVDFKNTLLPLIIGAQKRTPFIRKSFKELHAKDVYSKVVSKLINLRKNVKQSNFNFTNEEKNKIDLWNLRSSLFISVTSLSSKKNYPYKKIKTIVQELIKKNFPIVFIGEDRDKSYYKDILSFEGVVDLVGKTNFIEVIYLLKNYARLLLCVDTGILHLGSYLNIPMVVIFGSTESKNFGPWSDKYKVLKSDKVKHPDMVKEGLGLSNESMQISEQEIITAVENIW